MLALIPPPSQTYSAEYYAHFETENQAALAVWASASRDPKVVSLPGFLTHLAPEVRRYMASPQTVCVTLSDMNSDQVKVYQGAVERWLKAQKGLRQVTVQYTTCLVETTLLYDAKRAARVERRSPLI